MLSLVYDLRVLPATFDLANFIAVARARCIDFGFKDHKIKPIFIIGDAKTNYFNENHQEDAIRKRLERILLPLTSLFEFLENPIVIEESDLVLAKYLINEFKIIMPKNYNIDNPKRFTYFKNSMYLQKSKRHDLRYIVNSKTELDKTAQLIKSMCGVANPIVIVERFNQHSHDLSRDTSLDYLKDLAYLLAKRKPVIFVPDFMSRSYMSIENVYTFGQAAYDLRIKSALYELASISIQPPGAGSSLAYLNPKSVYIHNGVASGNYFDENWCTKNGFTKDYNDYSPNNPKQVWRWSQLSPLELNKLAQSMLS